MTITLSCVGMATECGGGYGIQFTVSANSLDDALSQAYDIAVGYFGSRGNWVVSSEATVSDMTISGEVVQVSVDFRMAAR